MRKPKKPEDWLKTIDLMEHFCESRPYHWARYVDEICGWAESWESCPLGLAFPEIHRDKKSEVRQIIKKALGCTKKQGIFLEGLGENFAFLVYKDYKLARKYVRAITVVGKWRS